MITVMRCFRPIPFLLLTVVVACGENPVQPGSEANELVFDPLQHLVSNPVSTNAAGDGNSTAANEETVAYVSLPPETYPAGVAANIKNAANGYVTSVALENGGFDPVPIPSAVGDTLFMSILDSAGTIIGRERAEVPPDVPPLIVRTRPAKGKIDVPINLQTVTVVFSELIDRLTVTTQTIRLHQGGADGVQLAGEVVLQANGFVAVLTLASPLEPGTQYTIVVTTGIRDLAGDALPSQEVVSFETLGIVAYVVVDSLLAADCGCGTNYDRVAVIDTKTHSLVKTIEFEQASWSDVMFVPNRPIAYLSSSDLTTVVIDAATHAPTGWINGLEGARHMTMSLDGRFAYAMHNRPLALLPPYTDLVVVSTENHEIVQRVPLVDRGTAFAVSPDGAVAYAVTEHWDVDVPTTYSIEVINVATSSVVATKRLPGRVSRVWFSPDGAFAYAANLGDAKAFADEGQSRIYVIGTADHDIVATIDTDRKGEEMVMTPDGAYLLLSDPHGQGTSVATMGDVTVIETATNSVIGRIGGVKSAAMLLTPDGSLLYATDPSVSSVWVMDVASMSIVTGIHVADLRAPSTLAFTSDGAFLYVGGAGINTVAVIATETNTVIAEIDVGGPIKDIAIMPGISQ